MSDKLVTIETYTYATESYLLVAKLEAEGIKAFIKNENLVTTQHLLSNAIGGIDVQVREQEVETALQVLSELKKEKELAEKIPAGLEKDYEKVLIYCPNCESNEVFRKKGSFFSFGAKEHVCTTCNHRWKQ